MRVFITGATGMIGQALVRDLREEGHSIVAYGRSEKRTRKLLGEATEFLPLYCDEKSLKETFESVDGIINLAGESLFNGRWTEKQKHKLIESRVKLTSSLVKTLEVCNPRPAFFISSSAIGYYGDRGDEFLTEESSPGSDFLARLCQDWEASAWGANQLGTRVTMLRLGIVFSKSGGALKKLMPIFKAGMGGRLGNGKQYMPWIHLRDLIEIIKAAMTDENYRGPINVVAPEAITNRQFTKVLGRNLRRPTFLPVPSFALNLMLGEAASVLLGGQNLAPRKLRQLKYNFIYPSIHLAL